VPVGKLPLAIILPSDQTWNRAAQPITKKMQPAEIYKRA
jgi:hypothetical protein